MKTRVLKEERRAKDGGDDVGYGHVVMLKGGGGGGDGDCDGGSAGGEVLTANGCSAIVKGTITCLLPHINNIKQNN